MLCTNFQRSAAKRKKKQQNGKSSDGIYTIFQLLYRYVPSSPGCLVEDITEIMNKEKLNDSTVEYKNENSISSGASKVTHNPKRLSFENAGSSQQAPKKAKKSLEAGWDSSTASDISYLIETPVSLYFDYHRLTVWGFRVFSAVSVNRFANSIWSYL